MSKSQQRLDFEAYMRQVDRHLAFTGLGYLDMVDVDYWSMFEDGVSAKDAAYEALAASDADDELLDMLL